MMVHQANHLAELSAHWENSLAQHKYDAAWISAGDEHFHFQDDHGPKFVPNPYLSQWVDPAFLAPGTRLLIQPGKKPILFLHQASDYWHVPAPLPTHLGEAVEMRVFSDQQTLLEACHQAASSNMKIAHIGPDTKDSEAFGESNPTALSNHLHFHRACKSEYELEAMRLASDVGALGHEAAEQSFHDGGTEFEIHMAFLAASKQNETELPYGNIVALNQHGAVLHYQHQDRHHLTPPLSLLIDAGGQYRGYASDITRTYVREGNEHQAFADLISRMQTHQDALIGAVNPGVTFAELHVQMHQQLAQVLVDSQLITCGAEEAFASGLTSVFCPHGLGHLLGLQVHDAGGHLADEDGTAAPPPDAYPTLRFTRAVEQDHVFTIEPGLYFIDSLLAEAKQANKPINWQTVADLSPYGGIRIEDNVRVLDTGVENLTRDAFDRLSHDQ